MVEQTYRPFVGKEKSIVKQNMLSMMKYSKIEYDEYKKFGEEIYLQQASEKLFNALELYLSYQTGYRYYAHQAVYNTVKSHMLMDLFSQAEWLHSYFYSGENKAPAVVAERRYNSLFEQAKRRIYSVR